MSGIGWLCLIAGLLNLALVLLGIQVEFHPVRIAISAFLAGANLVCVLAEFDEARP